MNSFNAKAYPEREELRQLAKSINSSQKAIENWFSYVRYKIAGKGVVFKSEWWSVIY